MTNVLEIKNLVTSFKTASGDLRAVNQINLNLERGKVTALVGESGCGKSMTALSVLRLIPEPPGQIESGEVLFNPQSGPSCNLLSLSKKEMRSIRGNQIAMIFQEPMSSLNPVFTVGDQIMEAICLHQGLGKKEAKQKAIEILNKVGIPNANKRVDDYPHQMSGGMRQRVMIAMGLSCQPEILIADEPTTALDVTIQAQILELMQSLIEEMGMTLLLITHDLGIVAEYADYVSVMYAGRIIEKAPVREIFASPQHPYTRGLLDSIPSLNKKEQKHLKAIPGSVPNLASLPQGCSFQDRCIYAQDDCSDHVPELLGQDPHRYRCFYPLG